LRAARAPIEAVRRYIEKLEYEMIDAPGRTPDGKLNLLKLSADDREKFIHEVSEPLSFLRDSETLDGSR